MAVCVSITHYLPVLRNVSVWSAPATFAPTDDSRTVNASDDAGRREPFHLVFHDDPLDSVTSDAQQSKTVEFVPPLGESMRGMSGKVSALIRRFRGRR
jgi:hypothetical protein